MLNLFELPMNTIILIGWREFRGKLLGFCFIVLPEIYFRMRLSGHFSVRRPAPASGVPLFVCAHYLKSRMV